MHEQVECRQITVDVGPEACKLNDRGDAQPGRQCAQLGFGRSQAEKDNPQIRMFGQQAGDDVQQEPMSLALDELGDDGDREVALLDAELLF